MQELSQFGGQILHFVRHDMTQHEFTVRGVEIEPHIVLLWRPQRAATPFINKGFAKVQL